MLGFEPTILASAPKSGRPGRLPSSRFRNLAWLRHLLDRLDDARRWSGITNAAPPEAGADTSLASALPPPGWWSRPADVAIVRQAFAARTRAWPSNPMDRSASVLDELLGPLFAGAEGGGGRYFSDRILRGEASPDVGRLQRLDDLLPGSRAAFDLVPSGVDLWFYDALDFTCPWFGKVFLWRALDPLLEDPGWDDVASREAGEGAWVPEVRNLRFAPHALSAADVHAFESLIEHAAALAAYPSVTHAPLAEHRAAIESVVDAATGGDDAGTVALGREVGRCGVAHRWVSLSDALAARRLSLMLGVGDDITAWWLRTVHAHLGVEFCRWEARCFLLPKRGSSPIDGVINALV